MYKRYEGFGFIFYNHNVVGNNIYFMYTKMGGRTHSGMIHIK